MNWLWKAQQKAAADHDIDGEAFRLFYRLCSLHNSDPKEPFKLSDADAADLLGYDETSRRIVRKKISMLVRKQFLSAHGFRGSPPTNFYSICDKFNCSQSATLESSQSATNKCSGKATNKCSRPAANLISTLPSEVIKSPMEEIRAPSGRDDEGGINGSASPRKMSQQESLARIREARKNIDL